MQKQKEKFNYHHYDRCAALCLDSDYIHYFGISNKERFNGAQSLILSTTYLKERACCIYDKGIQAYTLWGDKAFAVKHGLNIDFLDGFLDKLYKIYLDVFVTKVKTATDKEVNHVLSGFKQLLQNAFVDKVAQDEHDGKHRYIFVVPTHWDCAIREKLLRPIFIESGLIENDDHFGRLEFLSKLQCLVQLFQLQVFKQSTFILFQKMKEFRHCLLYECDMSSKDRAIITLTSFKAQNSDISFDSLLIPKSNKSVVLYHLPDIDRAIKDFEDHLIIKGVIGTGSEIMTPEQIRSIFIYHLKNINKYMIYEEIEGNYEENKKVNVEGSNEDNDEKISEEDAKSESVFSNQDTQASNELKLTELQQERLRLINPDELNEVIFAPYLSDIILSLKKALDYSSTKRHIMLHLSLIENAELDNNWDNQTIRNFFLDLAYYSLTKNPIRHALTEINLAAIQENDVIYYDHILYAALQISVEAMQRSDVKSPPVIIQKEHKSTNLPKIILHMDISFSRTECAFTLLDNEGTVTYYNDDIISSPSLRPLGEFLTLDFKNGVFSLALKAEQRLIQFIEEHFSDTLDFFSVYNLYVKATDDAENQDRYFEKWNRAFFSNHPCDNFANKSSEEIAIMGEILSTKSNQHEKIITVRSQQHIRTFLTMYVGFLNRAAIKKIKAKLETEINESSIGYTIALEKVLLENYIFACKEYKEIAYASGLFSKDEKNDDKWLRIFVHGENLFPIIQMKYKINLPVKSFYSQVQLYDNYMYVSINQVVKSTESNNIKEEAAIVVKEEIISYKNLYESMALKMWISLQQHKEKEVEYCSNHANNEKWHEDIYSLENISSFKTEFMAFITENLSELNSSLKLDTKKNLNLSDKCDCSVNTTLRNVIEIAVCPAFENVISSALATILSGSLLGRYPIRHTFLISCLSNVCIDDLFKKAITSKLQQFLSNYLELKEIHMEGTILSLNVDELFVSVIGNPSLSFGFFKNGYLRQIASQNLSLSFWINGYRDEDYDIIYRADRKTLPKKIVPPILRKGEQYINGVITTEIMLKCNRELHPTDIQIYLTSPNTDEHKIDDNEMHNGQQSKSKNTEWRTLQVYRHVFTDRVWQKDEYIYVTAEVAAQNWSSNLKVAVRIDDYDSYIDVNRDNTPINIAEPLTLAYL